MPRGIKGSGKKAAPKSKSKKVVEKSLNVSEIKAKIADILVPNDVLRRGGYFRGESVTSAHWNETKRISNLVRKLREKNDATEPGKLRR